MEHAPTWLVNSFIYLSAAVIGYLGAGMAIGPWGLGLVTNVEDILHFAEFGVVLMLFLVGLELEPQRLWSLRRPIFGWGSAQVLGCALLLMAVAVGFGLDWRLALVAGLGLALLPLLGVISASNEALAPVNHAHEAIKIIAFIAGIILGGRLLMRPLFRWIACSNTPEIFTAASLLLLVGIAGLMQLVGLSMALGAFLAGVLMAESEYRRELETDIEPFKGLLLGLFFIAVGMSIDFGVLRQSPGLLVAIDKLLLPRYAHLGKTTPQEISEPQEAPIVIAGFGRYGQIVARARDVPHWNQLRDRGVVRVECELFESSLRSARSVLELLGQSADEAAQIALRFRQHNLDLFEKMYPHYKDRAKFVAVARQGRQQLEAQMAQEREQRAQAAAELAQNNQTS